MLTFLSAFLRGGFQGFALYRRSKIQVEENLTVF